LNKAIFHLILFTLVLNISTGIIALLVVDINGNQIFGSNDTGLMPSYNSNGTQYFESQSSGVVNPAGVTEDKGNLVFRLLDLIGLGFINKLISIVDAYMYGFINLLNTLFGFWISGNQALYALLFGVNVNIGSSYIPIAGVLKTIITLGYVLAGIELWTNKSITD